jgi:Fur family zinc uptake transcriptional regulator
MANSKRQTAAFPKKGHDHDRCVADALASAESVCEQDGERLTPLRRRVLELVWANHRPVGAYALLDRLKEEDDRGAAPPTVYRALDFLLARGLIHRIESLNAFVGCAHPGETHVVQFLICKSCGTAAELDDRRLGDAIGRSAAEHGFSIQSRVIELSGVCSACQGGRSRGTAHAGD